MNACHELSDEIIRHAEVMFSGDHHWIAYNTHNCYLDEGDIDFFRDKEEAIEFAENNVSDFDNFSVIHASSVIDLISQLSYDNSIDNELNNSNNPSKTNFMNHENLNYLKENLKYMGFGDKLNDNLEHNIRQGFPEFVLKMDSEFNQSKLESTLHFSKSKETDMYFFNRHDAVLKNDVGTLEQSFYVNKGHGVTLKEAFNLLEGRAVYKELTPKEGERYHAWIQLDFKQKDENGNYKTRQFHENYGYNLAETLHKFPIKELMDEQKNERLMMSLQKGNLQSVTLNVEGKDQQYFIQANPQYKTLTIYDNGATRPLSNEQKVELMTPEARQKLNGKDVSTEKEQREGKEIKRNGTGKQKNEQKKEDSLLPKKRTSESKGLAIS